jgi:hypothetical protein
MADRNGFASLGLDETSYTEGRGMRENANGDDVEVCPACEGRRVKVVLPRRGLVVAAAGESGVLEPACVDAGQEPGWERRAANLGSISR